VSRFWSERACRLTVAPVGEPAEFAGMFRRNRGPGWLGRGEKAQRRLVEWQKLATGAKIGQQWLAVRRSAG